LAIDKYIGYNCSNNKGYSEKTFEVREEAAGTEAEEAEEDLSPTGDKVPSSYYLLSFFFFAVGIFFLRIENRQALRDLD